jgi:Tol biopolymer transport system component
VSRLDGSGARQLTPAKVGKYRSDATHPAPSPDGRQIVYTDMTGGPKRYSQLWIVNADGSGRRRLSPRWLIGPVPPSWSPDGREVMFQTSGALTALNARTHAFRNVLRLSDNAYEVRVSPNGKLVAYMEYGRDPAIWIRPLDRNRAPRRIAEDPLPYLSGFRWHPDSAHIVVSTQDCEVLAVNVATNERRTIVPAQLDPCYHVGIPSPDGKVTLLAAGWSAQRLNLFATTSGGGSPLVSVGLAAMSCRRPTGERDDRCYVAEPAWIVSR